MLIIQIEDSVKFENSIKLNLSYIFKIKYKKNKKIKK